jgi:multidrug resistance protein, MATE family
MNYLLGESSLCSPPALGLLIDVGVVWGPDPMRLGFIGAPIAAAISMNLISLTSITYGLLFVPPTAWHPLSASAFDNLGVLTRLSLGGVGQIAAEWWSWEIIAC